MKYVSLDEAISLRLIAMLFKRTSTAKPWDYLMEGVETEMTLTPNRVGFDYFALRPRILSCVLKLVTSISNFGEHFQLTVMATTNNNLYAHFKLPELEYFR